MTATMTMITPDPDADERRRRGLRRMRTLAVVAAAARRGGVRRHARPGRLLGLRERRRRGVDGGCDRGLVRGHRALQAPARAADPAHRADPEAQGRAGRGRSRSSWGRTSSRRRSSATGSPRPRSRCGSAAGSPYRSTRGGPSTRSPTSPWLALGRIRDEHIEELVRDALVPRFHEEPIAPLLGSLLEETVRDDLHHGLVDLALDELHALAGGQPRHRRRDPGGAGAVVGADAAQRRGHLPAAPRAGPAGSTTSATTRATTPGRRWTRCSPSSPTTCCNDPDTQERTERLKERLLDQPAGARLGRLALERAAPQPPGLARRPGRPVRARLVAETAAFAERLVADPALRARLDGLAADAAVFARRPVRRRAHRRHHPHRSSAGTARRPPAGSSCTSAATSSSSGSTAPSSAAWSVC